MGYKIFGSFSHPLGTFIYIYGGRGFDIVYK